MHRLVTYIFIIGLTGSLIGCDPQSVDQDERNKADQLELLDNTATQHIVPAYSDLKTAVDEFDAKIDELLVSPDVATLEAARIAFLESYHAWQYAAIFNFGPAIDNVLISLNQYPTNTSTIHQFIESGTYDLNTAVATFAKGFPAMDYLLYGYAVNDTDLLTIITENLAFRDYLQAVSNDIQAKITQVYTQWTGAGSYLDVFVNNPGTSNGSSLSILVNAWSQYIELHIRNAKVGTPNGNSVVTSERFGPFPEKAEAYYSQTHSVALLTSAMDAVERLYTGDADTAGFGIMDYLKKINAQNGTLADDYLAVIKSVQTELADLSDPLSNEITNNPTEVTEVFNSLKTMVALLKVDIVSALSVSITYADNDGD